MRIKGTVVSICVVPIVMLMVASVAYAQCVDCRWDDAAQMHTAPYSDEIIFGYYGPPHFQLQPGWCEFSHQMGCCTVCLSWDVTDGDDPYTAFATADAPELTRLLSKYTMGVTFNAERYAVQIENCSGEIIAHIPVRPKATASARMSMSKARTGT